LLFSPDADGVDMRKPDAAPTAASQAALPARSRDDASVTLVCLALTLALLALAFRIANIW
jgi:hypothetical protein